MQKALLSVLFWGTLVAQKGFERLFFFFSLLEKHNQCLMMCSSGVGTGKVQIGATFTLAGVASLSQSLRVSRLDLSSARATFKRNNLSHAGRKMLVWRTARMEGKAFVFKKKKKKKKQLWPPCLLRRRRRKESGTSTEQLATNCGYSWCPWLSS